MKSELIPSFLNQPEQNQPDFSNYLLPLREVNEYLSEELLKRQINPQVIGSQFQPIVCGLLQLTVDDFALYRGEPLNDERYSTRFIHTYLLSDDRDDMIEHSRMVLMRGIDGLIPNTYLYYPWYYNLLDRNYLHLIIDKRDITCDQVSSPPVLDDLSKDDSTAWLSEF